MRRTLDRNESPNRLEMAMDETREDMLHQATKFHNGKVRRDESYWEFEETIVGERGFVIALGTTRRKQSKGSKETLRLLSRCCPSSAKG